VTLDRDVSGAVSGPDERLRLEMSAFGAAHSGDGQSSLGLGVLSLVDLEGWLVGFQARADSYEQSSSSHENATLQLAVLLGRRLRHSSFSFDVLALPSLTLMNTSVVEVGPDGREQASASGALPRFLLATRLTLAPESFVRPFLGASAEVGATGAGPESSTAARLPALPSWTVGAFAGLTLGAP
jgi:hypothetical protein